MTIAPKCVIIICGFAMRYSLSELHLVIKLVQRSENAHLKHYLTFFKKQLNTQAYFGSSRMLRIGFVFDEPLRTPTYSIKFHTQAYFGSSRMLRIGFVFDEPLRTPTYSIKFHTQAYRSGHNEAVLKICRSSGSKSDETPWKHWQFRHCKNHQKSHI